MSNAPLPDSSWTPSAPAPFEVTYAETVRLAAFIARVRFRIPDDDADAIVQDAYLKLARDYAEVRAPKKWLAAAVTNACRNYWRDRPDETPLPDDAESWEDPRSSGAADAILTRLALAEALQRLGDRCRDMLRMFHLDGESTSRIAEAYGTTAGNVQFLLHSCRKKARSLYTSLTRIDQ